MAKFLTSNELNHELEKLFENAEEQIFLISPFIKLHERFISVLKTKMADPKLKVVVVFGKNEYNFSKSMKIEDFNFFKEFKNIEIKHERRLHAKYYANESAAILTSMNLYNFSQDNNIESGILLTKSLLSVVHEDGAEVKAAEYFNRVIDQSTTLFKKIPQFESTMLGLSKKYISSKTDIDDLSDFFIAKQIATEAKDRSYGKVDKIEKYIKPVLQTGFCIRTGKPIPFNIARPMCDHAFESWSKYKDSNYKEKHCHFSGELSNGQTSFGSPILGKNYKKAQETFRFT